MVHAFKLYGGPDKASHVIEGTVAVDDRTDVVAVHFIVLKAGAGDLFVPKP